MFAHLNQFDASLSFDTVLGHVAETLVNCVLLPELSPSVKRFCVWDVHSCFLTNFMMSSFGDSCRTSTRSSSGFPKLRCLHALACFLPVCDAGSASASLVPQVATEEQFMDKEHPVRRMLKTHFNNFTRQSDGTESYNMIAFDVGQNSKPLS